MTFPKDLGWFLSAIWMCFRPQSNVWNLLRPVTQWLIHGLNTEKWIKCFSPLCNIRHVMPDLQTEYGSASALLPHTEHVLGLWEAALLWMFSACFKDMRLDSCMSDSLSFVNKSNLCLILSSSSSKISDNHSGPHRGWKNHHAGIHICTICDGESCVVMDQSHTLKHTQQYIQTCKC